MQTIDLGTISIGGEDAGTPEPASAPCPVCAESASPASEEIFEESVVVESTLTQEPSGGFNEERRRPHPEDGHDIYFERCEDYKLCHIGDTAIDGQGRILDLTLRLRNVCPGKRVAVGILLNEIDTRGTEHPRGMKTFTVPAHRRNCCADVPVDTVRFILPEDIGVSGAGGPCGCRRHFVAKVSAHYVDFNSGSAAL